MARKTVAVLRGGSGLDHLVSVKTGAQILQALSGDLTEKYRAVDVFIDKGGVWHVRGVPTTPEKVLNTTDVVWNGLRGEYGEDGTVQRTLDRFGTAYTGSRAYPSSVAINKELTKALLKKEGLRVPHSALLEVNDVLEKDILTLFRSFPQPSVIKPINKSSSIGVSVANNFFEFKEGIKEAFQHASTVLVEEYIKGREATCGVVDALRGEDVYQLPPLEIIIPNRTAENQIFSYQDKYSDVETERSPGHFTKQESKDLQEGAATAHRALGLRHYSKSDFIVTPKGIYFLETNTLPGLSEQSRFPKALGAVGVSNAEFIDHIITLALLGR